MGFLAAATPWIIKGGAALGGALFGKHAQNAAQKRSGEEQQALGGAQNAAGGMLQSGGQLMQRGTGITDTGLTSLGQAGNYWSSLLGGNRAQMAQATAGPRAALTDVYRGAQRGLEHSGVRGAQRDVASAELNRDRASKIAGLTTGIQPMAAQALTDVGARQAATGLSTTETGGNLAQSAGSLYSNLLGQGQANRVYARREGENAGRSIGGFIFDILSGTLGQKGAPNLGKVPTGSVNDIPKLLGPGLPW